MNGKIKFFKASPFYKSYLDSLYFNNPTLAASDYPEQFRTIMDDCFGWADFWKINLEKLGNYEVCEVITNAELLQKQWAKEHDLKYSEENWLLEILEAQIAEFKPDVFFAHDFPSIKSDFRRRIKKNNPSIKVIIGWDGVALNDAQYFADYDLILSCSEDVTAYYDKNGFQTYFFPFGFETSIINRIVKVPPMYDVSFVGSVVARQNKHNARLKLLSEVLRKKHIDLWLSGLPRHLFFSKTFLRLLSNWRFDQLSDLFRLRRSNNGEIFGLGMYQILSDSKIAINSHVDAAKGRAGNSRLFEATGVGTCLLTEEKENLKDFFDVGREVVAYKSPEDAIEMIDYLLSHEEERKKIALAGQKRTLRDYTLEGRIKLFAEYLSYKF